MDVNAVPKYDSTDNPTGCCPRFDPEGWDQQDLHFKDKLFVRARTRSLMHIPVNMGSVFTRTFKAIEEAGAHAEDGFLVMSRDASAWTGEHYFAVVKPVPGQEMTRISGDFMTRVFEGPYRKAPKWIADTEAFATEHGKVVEDTYLFYTTCPKCAKHYGKNYVVAVARVH
jgi:hypothetical protein